MTSKKWNWQQDDWPDFSYDKTAIDPLETEFVKASGISIGVMRHLSKKDLDEFRIEMICSEALKTSEIEGAFLDRDSLQSSICKEFGLGEKYLHGAVKPEEAAIAMMMKDLYTDFNSPLTHEPLWAWHDQLLNGRTDLERGKYRTGTEDMRVVSGRIDKPNIHFIAPPASEIPREMDLFIRWFNKTAPGGKAPLPPLTRAGTAHLYFVTIHKTNQITPWLCYFGKTIIKARLSLQKTSWLCCADALPRPFPTCASSHLNREPGCRWIGWTGWPYARTIPAMPVWTWRRPCD